jgi:energy-coupling factor transporter ATPase
MEPLIRVKGLYFSYRDGSGREISALNGIDLTIREGELIAIIGANGSGKSTLARHFNGLLRPTQGDVWVNGSNTRDSSGWREIRRKVAMVFQHPESQAVATTIEEDVAFGPENLGVHPDEIRRRVDWALEAVGLIGLHKRAPHHLSGGQKQRLALAGVLAMQPGCIVLDEATSMLDPSGRRELRGIIQKLHAQGVTIVMITQDMDEAAICERVVVLSKGRVYRDDVSHNVMSDGKLLQSVGLDLPSITQLAYALHARRPEFPETLLTVNEFVNLVGRLSYAKTHIDNDGNITKTAPSLDPRKNHSIPELIQDNRLVKKTIIETSNLRYTYMRGTPLEMGALKGVDFTVQIGAITGIIGATGSGKTTLLQHLNGLLSPQSGKLRIDNIDIALKQNNIRTIRQQIALLFQQPEDQLFEQYVADDVAYGPINLGLPLSEVRQRVERAMEAVGLSITIFRDRSIYSLSGGERRRAALAGVLALDPKVLVLDEPTAGLDPRGRRELMSLLQTWQAQNDRSIVWASHSMEEIAQIAGQVTVMADGQVALEGTPRQVFIQADALTTYGLDVPLVVQVMRSLAKSGLNVPTDVLTVDEAITALEKLLS